MFYRISALRDFEAAASRVLQTYIVVVASMTAALLFARVISATLLTGGPA